MGNKYDLLDNLIIHFPKQEEVYLFIDLFGGSGVVSANVPYKNVLYNELNENIVKLFKLITENEPQTILEHINKRIIEFNLYNKTSGTRQIGDIKVREEANDKYIHFRKYYNKQKEKNLFDLFTLTFFSFCNLIRFNSKSEFNMPFGNRCFLKGEHDVQLKLFYDLVKSKNLKTTNHDAFKLLESITTNEGQFIYLDPPYSNTMAIYNESRAFGGWGIEHDDKIFKELDRLNKIGIKWALSNVLVNKGKENKHLKEWAVSNKYQIIDFSNKEYSALGKGNAKTQEVLIVNYETPFMQYSIFDFMKEE